MLYLHNIEKNWSHFQQWGYGWFFFSLLNYQNLTYKCIYTFIPTHTWIYIQIYHYFYLAILCKFLFNISFLVPILKIYKKHQVHKYIYTCKYGFYMLYDITTHTHMWTFAFKYIFLCILLHLYTYWECCVSFLQTFYLIFFSSYSRTS
jgi:hypothetical protein